MAVYYWVGGAGTWDVATTTNWAISSGGAGGAGVPTSADNVVLDANSGTGTITCTAGVCQDLTVSASQALVLGAAASTLSVYGSLIYPSGGAFTQASGLTITFAAISAKTLLSNGKTMGALSFAGTGGSWTLSSALTAGAITHTRGSVDTANYAVAATSYSFTGSASRNLSLGSSTLTFSGSSPWAVSGSGYTLDASTSTIVMTNATVTFSGAGQIYNDISFSTAGNRTINGANTFNNVTFTPATGDQYVSVAADQIINGTLTISGNGASATRYVISSTTYGTQVTLQVAAVAALTDLVFRSIVVTGAAAPFSGTRLGDAGNNTGITFSAPKTVYWNRATGGSWLTATAWATTTGAAAPVAGENAPLPQDTAVFQADTATLPAGTTINIIGNSFSTISTIDASARTANAMTFAISGTGVFAAGDWINGSGVTITGTTALLFYRPNKSNIVTSAGRTFTTSLNFAGDNGTTTLSDALTTSLGVTLTSGTLNCNSVPISATTFTSTGTRPRSLILGTSAVTLSNSGTVWSVSGSSFTVSYSPAASISLTSATAKTFAGGSYSYPKLIQAGAGALTITGNNSFYDMADTSLPSSILFTSGSSTSFINFTLAGTAGNLVTVGATTTSPATLVKASAWLVGANSVDGGNNTGLSFTAGSSDYLSISYISGALSFTSASDTATALRSFTEFRGS